MSLTRRAATQGTASGARYNFTLTASTRSRSESLSVFLVVVSGASLPLITVQASPNLLVRHAQFFSILNQKRKLLLSLPRPRRSVPASLRPHVSSDSPAPLLSYRWTPPRS